MDNVVSIQSPYLVFMGGADNPADAKTAAGIAQWTAEQCLGQLRFATCTIDTGLPDMDIATAVNAGAKSLLIGVAPVGGAIQEDWLPTLSAAISAGLDIVAGLHMRLNDNALLATQAAQYGVQLIDVRVPPPVIPIGNGRKRTGRRLLTVGTDCSVGKKYTALAVTRAMKLQGIDCDFRATGQTGIMISGVGIPIDAVVADFIAGAAESLSPDNRPDHWDIIEGQGSLFQPAYAGVSLGLLHGSQPDAIILCHDPVRTSVVGCPGYPVVDIKQCIKASLDMGRLTNPHIRCVGISVNTSAMAAAEKNLYLEQLQQETDLPCFDPLTDSLKPLISTIINDRESVVES